MAQKDLVPFNKLTEEEQKKIAQMGGKASVEARRARKTLKETLLMMLEDGDTQNNITLALLDKALSGDTKAYEVIRDTIGEKPTDKVEQINTSSPYSNLTEEELRKLAGG